MLAVLAERVSTASYNSGSSPLEGPRRGILDPRILHEVHQDDAGCAVEVVALVQAVEELRRGWRAPSDGPRAVELRFAARGVEVLFFSKDGDPPGGESVAPGLDAGRLQVPQEMGEKILPIHGSGRRSWFC